MAGESCHNCVYSCCDPELWLRCAWAGEPLVPRCANHPLWPGRLHDVPGVPCPNYRRKPALPEGDEVRMIPLSDGFYAYVDAADYEWLSQWKWYMSGSGYAMRVENHKRIYMHRQIMRPPKGKVVDHIDGNKANNCRFNLRVCTLAENQRNKRKSHAGRSQYKGVTYDQRKKKWFARCRIGDNRVRLCYCNSEVDAARAYDRAAVASFGPYARPNFPEEWPPERRERVYAEHQAALSKEAEKAGTGEGRRAGTKEGKKAGSRKTSACAQTPRRRERKRRTKGCPKAGSLKSEYRNSKQALRLK
jgi:hypothetical protein